MTTSRKNLKKYVKRKKFFINNNSKNEEKIYALQEAMLNAKRDFYRSKIDSLKYSIKHENSIDRKDHLIIKKHRAVKGLAKVCDDIYNHEQILN